MPRAIQDSGSPQVVHEARERDDLTQHLIAGVGRLSVRAALGMALHQHLLHRVHAVVEAVARLDHAPEAACEKNTRRLGPDWAPGPRCCRL